MELEDLELQTIIGLVEDASRLWKELAIEKEDEDRLFCDNKVVLELGTEFSE